jgi:hypothetical protein
MAAETALQISNRYHNLTQWATDAHLGKFYHDHPVMSRCIFIPIAAIRGLIKPLFFMIRAIALAIIFPVMAIVRACQGKESCEYIKAGMLNFLGAAFTVSFLIVSAYYMPLAASASIYMGATVISIAVHIYRASEAPRYIPNVEFGADGADGAFPYHHGHGGDGGGGAEAVAYAGGTPRTPTIAVLGPANPLASSVVKLPANV